MASHRTKPTNAPEWAQEIHKGFSRLGGPSERIAASARKLMESRDCGIVWKTIEARTKAPRLYVFELFMAISKALYQPPAGAMTPSNRRLRSQRIIKAATTLQKQLAETMLVPRKAMISAANNIVSRMAPTVTSAADHESEISFVGFGIAATFSELLEGLKVDADAWASESVVERPKKPNAARTQFVQQMSKHFIARFDTPLREVTRALTMVYFDVDLQIGDITRLAPDERRTAK